MKKLLLIFLISTISYSQDTIKHSIDVDSINDTTYYTIKGNKLKGLVSLIYGCQQYKSTHDQFIKAIKNQVAILEKKRFKTKKDKKLLKELKELI